MPERELSKVLEGLTSLLKSSLYWSRLNMTWEEVTESHSTQVSKQMPASRGSSLVQPC